MKIRDVKRPHWRRWLGPVPATSFCECADTKPSKTPKWVALDAERPLFAFAGLWTPWRGVRGLKSTPVEGEHELFGFPTTEPNAILAPFIPGPCRSFRRVDEGPIGFRESRRLLSSIKSSSWEET